ncbi:MAG: ammonium transporter [Symploca sp. SIO1C4]|uniref:Ammonium transporter n=1 Tax=Symploca sp. SIO1C4 TaxID=2607765 RepID=A0A6B3NCK1_9CYAN|nr:ammonium transporter [Symploca sp. SIO1C4]
MWVIFAACLVFFMNAGFGMLEAGFCRRKNAANILTKNLVVFSIATLAFWSLGFAFMMGDSTIESIIGLDGFFLNERGFSSYKEEITIPIQAAFLFQLVFAGTAATIVSGAVAERIKLKAFFLFSLVFIAISYPITGHWVWADNGWLKQLGFLDFAGSTVVHAVGGMAALVGAYLLGPRQYLREDGEIVSRYKDDGTRVPIFPHNLSIATLGCFILWLGWFGFNGGSTLSADPEKITHILLTTNIAAATSSLTVAFTTSRLKIFDRKPELSMIINGVLGGLVSITASSAYIELWAAAIIGIVAGLLVVFLVDRFNKWKIDDPVGAISVHLGCGIWGTLAVTLINQNRLTCDEQELSPLCNLDNLALIERLQQLGIQLFGISVILVFTLAFSLITWLIIKTLMGGISVPKNHEIEGLDLQIHGITDAYHGFKKE